MEEHPRTKLFRVMLDKVDELDGRYAKVSTNPVGTLSDYLAGQPAVPDGSRLMEAAQLKTAKLRELGMRIGELSKHRVVTTESGTTKKEPFVYCVQIATPKFNPSEKIRAEIQKKAKKGHRWIKDERGDKFCHRDGTTTAYIFSIGKQRNSVIGSPDKEILIQLVNDYFHQQEPAG